MHAGNKKMSHFLTLGETKTTSTMLLKDCSLSTYESPSQAQEGLAEPGSDMCHSGQTVKPALLLPQCLAGPESLRSAQHQAGTGKQTATVVGTAVPVLTVLSRSCQPWSL